MKSFIILLLTASLIQAAEGADAGTKSDGADAYDQKIVFVLYDMSQLMSGDPDSKKYPGQMVLYPLLKDGWIIKQVTAGASGTVSAGYILLVRPKNAGGGKP